MKVFIWTKFVDSLYRKEGYIGGIAIQMNNWAEIFAQKGWDVFSLSTKEKREYNKITFLRYPSVRFIGIFIEWFLSMYYILTKRPDIIITRGASRNTLPLALFSKVTKSKLVFFGASDSDFIIGEELINSDKNKVLYRNGLKKIKYVVAQNEKQQSLLKDNYGEKNCIIIPNIWPTGVVTKQKKDIDFLWVSNFRDLKRPEWFIKLAQENPQYKFAMIGGSTDRVLYNKCEQAAKEIPNLAFLGKKSLDETNEYFKQARCFICTSTMEGFPNTFLQAWSNNIPVLTTFSPSKLVEKHSLGVVVTKYDEMKEELSKILEETSYKAKQEAIKNYFESSHSPASMYNKLIQMLSL